MTKKNKKKTDIGKLLDRLILIIDKRTTALEQSEELSDVDIRSLEAYVKICLAIKKEEKHQEERITKEISKMSTEELTALVQEDDNDQQ